MNPLAFRFWSRMRFRMFWYLTAEMTTAATNNNKHFLLFHPIWGNQGQGQMMSGLLAAHLLGKEFDRTVCVSQTYTSFRQAFEPQTKACQELVPEGRLRLEKESIALLDYAEKYDECDIYHKLSNRNIRILHFTGNTYPSGFANLPSNNNSFINFLDYYQPTRALLEILPWKNKTRSSPPKVVVHLRQPDGTRDARRGLDDRTLQALGGQLPNHTFLVTNRVDWYLFFETKYHWNHPPWQNVQHSAIEEIDWANTITGSSTLRHTQSKYKDNNHGNFTTEKGIQNLQLWSDWYTLWGAETVYHTHSAFSGSAISWNGKIQGYVICGSSSNNNTIVVLDLVSNCKRNESHILPLFVDRKRSNQLRYCHSHETFWKRFRAFLIVGFGVLLFFYCLRFLFARLPFHHRPWNSATNRLSRRKRHFQ